MCIGSNPIAIHRRLRTGTGTCFRGIHDGRAGRYDAPESE